MLAICTDVVERTGYGRTETREGGRVGRMGISEGIGWGKLPFHHLYKDRIEGVSV